MAEKRFNLLTVTETMDLLGVSRSTLDRWRKDKRLPFIKIGKEVYFPLDDLEQWVTNQKRVMDPGGSRPFSPEILTVGYQSGSAYMWSPLIIKSLGLFEEELTRFNSPHPLAIRWHNAADGLELVEGMLAGTIQLASLGDYPILLSNQLSRILPNFRAVLLALDGKTAQDRGISIVIRKGSIIQTATDLSGATVATVVRSSAGHRLDRLMETMRLRHVRVIHQDMNRSLSALAQCHVEASVLWEPYVSLAHMQGIGRVMDQDGLGEEYLTGIVASSIWAEKHEAVVLAYLRAHLRAHRLARRDPFLVARIITKETGFPVEITDKLVARIRWDAAVYQRDVQTLKNLGGAQRPDEVPVVYSGDYLDLAARQLGLPHLNSTPMAGDWPSECVY